MRLWTFQTKECLTDLINKGIWYSNAVYAKRIKNIDMCYVRPVKIGDSEIFTAPIYCFANMRNGDPLCLHNFVYYWNEYNDYWNIDLSLCDRVMLELELPESEIYSMKDAMFYYENMSEFEKSLYPLYYSDYKKALISTESTMEALLPYIKLEWVAAYRVFSYDTLHNDTLIKLQTYQLHSGMFPLWVTDLYIRDGKRLYTESHNELSIHDRDEFESAFSMRGCPRYYTVRDALDCCCGNTCAKIYNKLDELGITDYITVLIRIIDLFPDGLLS